MCFISMLSTIPGMSLEKCTEISQRYSSMNELCSSFTDEWRSPPTPTTSAFRKGLPYAVHTQLERTIFNRNSGSPENVRGCETLYAVVKHHLTRDSLHYITMLCQIPCINIRTASLICDYFPTMSELCFAFSQSSSPYTLGEIIDPALSAKVYEFLGNYDQM